MDQQPGSGHFAASTSATRRLAIIRMTCMRSSCLQRMCMMTLRTLRRVDSCTPVMAVLPWRTMEITERDPPRTQFGRSVHPGWRTPAAIILRTVTPCGASNRTRTGLDPQTAHVVASTVERRRRRERRTRFPTVATRPLGQRGPVCRKRHRALDPPRHQIGVRGPRGTSPCLRGPPAAARRSPSARRR
jgi:hypothetical protein